MIERPNLCRIHGVRFFPQEGVDSMIYVYLTIIPRARVGYEMIDSQRGA